MGYQLSPLLWKKIRSGLSAGRVQSVATRMVCDREHEIAAFQPQEYWSLDASLERVKPNVGKFTAQFYGREKKQELHNEDEVKAVMAAVEKGTFSVTEVKRQDRMRNPSPPFTTSTLQQEASKVLNFSTQKTMRLAQQLYEGVEIKGNGTTGIITYLRTDSTRISDEAEAAARAYITEKYGEEYAAAVEQEKKPDKKIQDAHEAIRPTDISRLPLEIKESLSRDQFRLYQLIWKRFVASRMTEAVYETTSVKIDAAGQRFTVAASKVKFDGFMSVYVQDDDKEESNKL